jgi:hypothetical protein
MAANIVDILRAAVMTPGSNGRWGLPILIEGEPGTGKTSRIRSEVAEPSALHLETLIASIREPADFLGFPIPAGESIKYAVAAWAQEVVERGEGLVFLDELNTAPPAVQAALLRVVLDGVVGDVELPNRVRFMAAQNSTEDAAGGWDLAPPLANRFGHLKWDAPMVDDWSAWLTSTLDEDDGGTCISAEEQEAEVEKQWPEAWSRACGVVTGFLRRRPELLHKMPAADDPARGKAWPSARSWENGTRAFASSIVHGLDADSRDSFVGAFIGMDAAYELISWMNEADLPDPIELLEGRVEFAHDPYRLDKTTAVLNACIGFVAPEDAENREKRAEVLWCLLADIVDEAADLVLAPAQKLAQARLTKSPKARKALAKLQPILGLTAS